MAVTKVEKYWDIAKILRKKRRPVKKDGAAFCVVLWISGYYSAPFLRYSARLMRITEATSLRRAFIASCKILVLYIDLYKGSMSLSIC